MTFTKTLGLAGILAGALALGGCAEDYKSEREKRLTQQINEDVAYFGEKRFSREEIKYARETQKGPRGLERYPKWLSLYQALDFRKRGITPEMAKKLDDRFTSAYDVEAILQETHFVLHQISLYPRRFNSADVRILALSEVKPESAAAYPDYYERENIVSASRLGLEPEDAVNYSKVLWYNTKDLMLPGEAWKAKLSPEDVWGFVSLKMTPEEVEIMAAENRKYGDRLRPSELIRLRNMGLSNDNIINRLKEAEIEEMMKK